MTEEQRWFFGIIFGLITTILGIILKDGKENKAEIKKIKEIAISNATGIANTQARLDNQEKTTEKIPCLNAKPCYMRGI